MSTSAILPKLSADDRICLIEQLQVAILDLLNANRSIYLEKFGMLFPTNQRTNRSDVRGDLAIAVVELQRSVRFERCAELTAYHREKYPNLVEMAELAQIVYTLLPMRLAVQWSERVLANLLRERIAMIKEQTVRSGFCCDLERIGYFYSLHNRQGTSFKDWFAGADIFIRSSYQRVMKREQPLLYSRPVLESAWELPAAICEAPPESFEIDVGRELSNLGYEIPSTMSVKPAALAVKCFRFEQARAPLLWYVTDGLRSSAYAHDDAHPATVGNEFVFQVECSDTTDSLQRRAVRALTLGWILMNSAASKSVKIGAGLAAEQVFDDSRERSSLAAVFSTYFSPARGEQLARDGIFRYINLVGITCDEVQWAQGHSSEHLLALLEEKRLDQVTKFSRSSLLLRSHPRRTSPRVSDATRLQPSYAGNSEQTLASYA